MANLGTLWFGADIDLTKLQQKINQGNQGILNALKVNYDPQSYQQMVGKLRSALARETFEINISANTQKALQNIRNTASGLGVGGMQNGLDSVNEKILRQKQLVAELAAQVRELRTEWEKMGGIRNKGSYDEIIREKTELQKLMAMRRQYNESLRGTSTARMEATRSSEALSKSNIKLNTTMIDGIHISSQFGSAMVAMFAVHEARQFLENVIEIGGQLEKQRISMGAIIGDAARANDLFENIKSLALQSPFGVVELDQYSKQLAAYGIEQSELFDMTKRLADISAGAGQDISRLALALGHVKSATYLTGITLRQFSMNNIPMLKMLADYYSEVEKRAVSTAEVQKRISSRQVSYDDVVEQIKRMTDEGGQFYNMQEKISGSLSAKFKNLRDSFDIMYGEIAESSIGDFLKKFAEGATQMSREWKTVANVLADVAVLFGAQRLAMTAVNWATVNLNKNTIAAALSNGRLSASMMDRYVRTGQITKAQLLEAVATKRVTAADAELAAANWNITRAQLERVAASGRYIGMLGLTSLATSRYTVAQLRMIAALRSGELTTFSKGLTGIRLGLSLVTTGAKAATAAVAGFLKPLSGFLIFSSVLETFMEKSRKAEEQEQRLADMAEKANEGYRNMSETRENFRVGGSADMSDDAITKAIPDMVEQLRNYSQTATETFNNAFAINSEGKAIHSLKEQYEILAKGIENTTEAYKEYQKIAPMIEHSMQSAEPEKSWIDRFMLNSVGRIMPKEEKAVYMDLKESIGFYTEAINEASTAEQVFLRNHLEIVSTLEQMGVTDAAEMTNEQILETLTMWQTVYPSKFKEFTDKISGDTAKSFDGVIDKWEKLSVASVVATDRMKKAGEDFYASAKVTWGEDMTQWPENWKDVVLMAMRATGKGVRGFEELSEEAKNNLYNIWLEPFNIKVDTSEAQQQVNNLLVDLENLVGKEWTVQIGVKGVSSIEDVDNATKAYEQAVKDVETTTARLGRIKDKNSEEFKQTLKDQQDSIAKRDAAQTVITEYGGVLPEPKKNKGGKRSGGGGNKTDEQLKLWREELKELQEFWREYETLLKRMNSEDALAEISKRGLFPSLFSDKGELKFDVRKGLSTALSELLAKTSATTTERMQFQIELKKAKFNVDEKAIKEAADRALSELNEYISRQGEKYNLFKSLFEKTGNKDFAEAAFSDGRIFDEYSRELEQKLKEASGEVTIDFSMTDVEAKEHYKGIVGGYELWKKIVEIVSGNYKDALTTSADAIRALETDEEKMLRIEREIADLRSKKDENGNPLYNDSSPVIIQKTKELEKTMVDVFKHSSEYAKFYNSILSMSVQEAEEIGQKIRANLVKELKNGSITAQQYVKEVKRINEQMEKLRKGKSTLSAFFESGLQGLFQNYYDTAESNYNSSATDYYKAAQDYASALKKGDESAKSQANSAMKASNSQMAGASAAMKGAQGAMSTVAVIDKIIHGINDTVQAIAATFSDIKETAEALGADTGTDGWQNATAFFDTFSKSSQHATDGWDALKNGNIAGAVQHTVGSITSIVKGIAQLHDNKLNKAIERSQLEVKKLQNAYKNLSWEIETQLTTISKKQSEEMLANLKRQEEELESQLENEKDKKKKDKGKIIDLEQDVEEAKQQIRQFYEDLGRERYGLDLDSWAGDIASALTDAFSKGEDAAEAFDKKVADIMKNVVNNIIKISVVKPAMDTLRDFLFGANGVATSNSAGGVEITPEEASQLVSQLLRLRDTVESGKNVYDIVANAMRSMGLDVDGDDSSSSSSSSIKSISEQTADLLASYINAIRADVSVMRENETYELPAINVTVQRMSVLSEAQVQLQTQIAENTNRNAAAAEAIERALSLAARDRTFGFFVK